MSRFINIIYIHKYIHSTIIFTYLSRNLQDIKSVDRDSRAVLLSVTGLDDVQQVLQRSAGDDTDARRSFRQQDHISSSGHLFHQQNEQARRQ